MTTKVTLKMALIKKDNSVNIPATNFESDPDSLQSFNEVTGVKEASEVALTSTEIVASKSRDVSQVPSAVRVVNPFARLLNAIPVEFNSFKKIEVKPSGFVIQDGDSKVSLGDAVLFEVLSYQTSFVVTPGSSGADASSKVKYSDDGRFTKDGRSCTEYLAELLLDFPYASIKERCVVVVDLIGAPKASKDVSDYVESQPYLLDLPPSSRKNFYSYFNIANFSVNKGRLSPDRVQFIKASLVEKSGIVKGSKTDWQEVVFSASPTATST